MQTLLLQLTAIHLLAAKIALSWAWLAYWPLLLLDKARLLLLSLAGHGFLMISVFFTSGTTTSMLSNKVF